MLLLPKPVVSLTHGAWDAPYKRMPISIFKNETLH